MKRLLLCLVLGATACDLNPFGPSRKNLALYVSEISAPVSVSSGGHLTATIIVMTGGCKKFEHFTETRTSAGLTLEARGTDNADAGTLCTTDIKYEPHTVDVAGPFVDPFSLRVLQPDGSFLVRTVRVD
jgi:hypothetical protein